MSTGLQQFFEQSEKSYEKSLLAFNALATSLASGDDVDPKKIAAVCKAAGMEPTDLKAAIQTASDHLAKVAAINDAALCVLECGAAFDVMRGERDELAKEEEHIRSAMVDYEVRRRLSMRAESDLLFKQTNLMDQARAARAELLDSDAGSYGIGIPAVPVPASQLQRVIARTEWGTPLYDRLVHNALFPPCEQPAPTAPAPTPLAPEFVVTMPDAAEPEPVPAAQSIADSFLAP